MVFVITFVITGGWVSRMCGGGWPKLPFGVDQWLYAIPYAVIAFISLLSTVGGLSAPYPYFIWIWPVAALIWAAMWKRNGTRVFLDLGEYKGEVRKPHKLEALMGPLKGRVSDYWYDFIGLGLKGFFISLLPCAIVAYTNYQAALWVLIGGLLQPLGYAIGKKLGFEHYTAVGEFLTGAFAWGFIALAIRGVYFG